MKTSTFLLIFVGLFTVINVINCQKKIVCYYTNWAQYRPEGTKYFPENIRADLCTHVIYAFVQLDSNYELSYTEWNDDVNIRKVVAKKNENPDLKVLIAVGGWNQGSVIFSEMVNDVDLRKKFVSTSVRFLRQNRLDGLDLDWEYPSNRGGQPSDKALFTTLCKELKAAFTKDDDYLLSAAVGVGVKVTDSAYEVKEISEHLDFINLMAYDLHGSWESFIHFNAPLEGDDQANVVYVVDYWLSKGAKPEKLILGLATYGRSFTLTDSTKTITESPAEGPGIPGNYTGEGGFLSYYEICDLNKKEGWVSKWDDFYEVPYSFKGDQWVGYDNKVSIELKVEFALESDLGGVMFWAMDTDDFNGSHCNEGEYPLIRKARSALGYTDDVVTVTDPPAPITLSLTTEPSTTTEGPSTTEPLTTESITTEEPITTEPLTTEAITTEPSITEATTAEELTTTEPLTTEAITTEPSTTESTTIEEPITTEPLTTESITTEEPITTESLTTEAITNEPSTTEATTAEELATTEPLTTEAITTETSTTESTTIEEPIITEPLTTEAITTELSTTEPIITRATTTEVPSAITSVKSSHKCSKGDGYYADKTVGCQKFYICVGTVHFSFDCPAGLLFNDAITTCDYPQNVECQN